LEHCINKRRALSARVLGLQTKFRRPILDASNAALKAMIFTGGHCGEGDLWDDVDAAAERDQDEWNAYVKRPFLSHEAI